MNKEIKELFILEKYKEASILCRQLLQEDSENHELWYMLFLSDNDNYININFENLNNEMAFNKAIELADNKNKNEYIAEYNFYKNMTVIPNMRQLYRYAQFEMKDRVLKVLSVIEKNKYSLKIDNLDEFYNYLYTSVTTTDKNELLYINSIITKLLYFITDDETIYHMYIKILFKARSCGNKKAEADLIKVITKHKHDGTYNDLLEKLERLKDINKKIENQEEYTGDPVFEIKNGILFSYQGNQENIIIPEEVLNIKDSVFKNNKYVKNVTLPYTLQSIGESAFENCINLETINIPNEIITITKASFKGCKKLKNINITANSNLKYIEESAFSDCINIESIVLPKKLTKINKSAFWGTVRLVEIYNLSSLKLECGSYLCGEVALYAKTIHKVLGDSKTKITNEGLKYIYDDENECYVYDYIGNDDYLILPSNIELNEYSIAPYAFSGNETIKTLVIPKEIKSIGKNIVQNCENLIDLTIPYLGKSKDAQTKTISYIGIDISRKTTIERIELTNETNIGEGAFRSIKVKNIILPPSVTKISSHAFYMSSLESIVLHKNLKTILYDSFESCKKLKNIYFYGSKKEWDKIDMNSQTKHIVNKYLRFK